MNTLDYLFGPGAALFWPPVLVALVVGIVGSALSPLVVVRRMAFIGQGVSHSAFAGVGFVALIAWVTRGAGDTALVREVIVAATCVGAGLGIAWLSRRDASRADTAIGVVLVGAMALGFVLLRAVGPRAAELTGENPPSIEGVLFGSIVSSGWDTLAWSAGAGALILGAAWWWRRAIAFWAFDPAGAEAFGVPVHAVRTLVIVLLALTIVVAMRVAGVVLASAVLIAPGAAALALSAHAGRVLGWSIILGMIGVLAGLILAFELDLPPGPGIGIGLVAVYGLARLLGRA